MVRVNIIEGSEMEKIEEITKTELNKLEIKK